MNREFARNSVAFVMSKLITRHHLWYSVAIVIGITAYSVLTTNVGFGLAETIAHYVFPSGAIQVPMIIAWWLFLPLAVMLFSRRRASQTKHNPGESR